MTASSRSPTLGRQPQLQRQNSRALDSYGNIPGSMYTQDDTMSFPRFDNGRNHFNVPMQSAQMNGSQFPYDMNASQTWNPNGNPMQSFGGNHSGFMGAGGSLAGQSRLKPSRGRTVLPNVRGHSISRISHSLTSSQGWLDQNSPMPPFAGYEGPRMGGSQTRHDSLSENDEELIPTAIVIKNIPFAVKKEQLVGLMTEMGLPLPYAFNYHFDNGVFRGLAFANFTSPDETATVISYLNHYELQGRKLRVEYKKMLPLQERERIEREKRERRGQLEEQHRPIGTTQLHAQGSMSSLSSHLRGPSPSPLSQQPMKPSKNKISSCGAKADGNADVDMNDPRTLEFYTDLMMFRNDNNRETCIFPSSLTPDERLIVHTLAHSMGLAHSSRGNGDQRQVHVHKTTIGPNISPPNSSLGGNFHNSDLRRGLSRSATTDFSEARQADNAAFNTLRGQSSVGLLGVFDSSNSAGNSANLRAAKSFADLRTFTPSPAASTASFPAGLQTNGARLQQHDSTVGSNTPTLTPTSNAGLGFGRDENFLVSGLGSMSLGKGLGPSSSPRRQRNLFSWGEDSQSYPATAPIGSNRTVSLGLDNNSHDRLPTRQPRGPAPERGSGFRRQNGRGSDELRNGPGIIAE